MNRHALFVGVNTYDDPSIRPLRFSIPDASVLADRFRRLGFATKHLPDPTGAELLSAVEESTGGLGPGDVFLFFFAGHGFTAQDGAHLLFCRDHRQRLLRVNNAGIRVDALEELTADGGFHRAFLLDSCRTDCFAGAAARGAAGTRDLDIIAMPAASAGAGSFFLLRSCDKFRPSLELEDLGHGLFTQGLLDAMDERDARLAACDSAFADAVRDRMEELQRRHYVMEPQRPSIGEISGAGFALFQDGFLKTAPSRSSVPAAPFAAPAVPMLVECPVCGRNVPPSGTYNCRKCGRKYVCGDCWDAGMKCCSDCAREARDKAAREKARVEEAEARREAERERQRESYEASRREEEARQKAARMAGADPSFTWKTSGRTDRTTPPKIVVRESYDHLPQTECEVKLTHVPADRKVAVIKEVRRLTGLGPMDAKLIVERHRVVKSGLSLAEAEEIAEVLRKAGARVLVQDGSD